MCWPLGEIGLNSSCNWVINISNRAEMDEMNSTLGSASVFQR
jgi:hypothetical protein